MEYCSGMDASRVSGRWAGRASSGAVRACGTLGMIRASGVASIASSVMSALYLTCRIWTTYHQANIFAHTLQY